MMLVEAISLSKAYKSGSGDVCALRSVSLTIRRNEFIAIMGPSGSGKSTLMSLLGLLDTPTCGLLRIEGRDATLVTPDERAAIRNRRVGFVFQSYNLLPRLNAIENVTLPLIYAGIPANERRDRAWAALEAVGLGHRARHWPSQLSGGEQQRVAIARAMVMRPALVLADEPTGALDSKTGADVMALLSELNAAGTAVVVVTHDREVAARAGRIVNLVDGRIANRTRREAFYLHPALRVVDGILETAQ